MSIKKKSLVNNTVPSSSVTAEKARSLATLYAKLILLICVFNGLQILFILWDYDLCGQRGGVIFGLVDFHKTSWCQFLNVPNFEWLFHSPISRESPVKLYYYVAEWGLLLGIVASPLQYLLQGRLSLWLLMITSLALLTQILFRVKVLSYGGLIAHYSMRDLNFWLWTLLISCFFVLWIRKVVGTTQWGTKITQASGRGSR